MGSGTTASVTFPAAVTANNQLLVAVYVSHPQVLSVTDTNGGSPDTFVSVLSNGKGGHQPPNSGDSNFDCVYQGQFTLYLYFVAAAVGGTTTINVSGGGLSGTYIAAIELNDVTGLDTGGSAINSNSTGSNAGGFFTTGGVTSTNAQDIIFSIYAGAVSASVGPASEIGTTPQATRP